MIQYVDDAERRSAQSWSHDVVVALQRLEPREQNVLRLLYFHHHTQDEVARELSLPRRAVARAAAAGLQRLELAMRPPALG